MLEPKKPRAADTLVIVGPYRIPVSRNVFVQWEQNLMGKAGFTAAAIHAEILRRLGICK